MESTMETMQAVEKLVLACLPTAALIRLLFQDEAQPSSIVSCEVPVIYPERLKRRLEVAHELLMRELKERMQAGLVLNRSGVVSDWLRLHFKDREREAFVALALDSQHRLIEATELFQGTISSCPVYAREVVHFALTHRASALFIAHNHPSGIAEVSAADRQLTKGLEAALGLIDVRLLDHFIVAGATVVSMAEEGML
jgi:DNA repair protein RadC